MKLISYIIFCLLSPISYTYALSQDDEMHIAAHVGVTYIVTHGSEVICTKAIGKENKVTCTILGFTAANVINISRKVSQGMPNDSKRAIASGLLGSGLAVIVIGIDF